MNKQIRWLGIALLICFVLLFLQLNNIEVLQSNKLANAPGNIRKLLDTYSQPRGMIETANGVVVARSVPDTGIYKYKRVYPYGPLYAEVTGYYSLIYGSTGVEATYNSYLVAHKKPITTLHDLLEHRTVTDDVILTINSKLQQEAAAQLGNEHGSVVVLQPSTGDILAMYSNPSYNPNLLASHNSVVVHKAWQQYQSNPEQPMLTRAYSRSYPPGSTFKIVTASGVYNYDPKLANLSVPVMTGLPLPGTTHILHNYDDEACGGKIAQLFKVSCDSGFATLGLKLGAKRLYQEAESFGFNSVPPLDLTDVAASTFPPPSSFVNNLPMVAFSAIGQGNVSVTPLQTALDAAAIANKGVIMRPHVVEEIRNSQGQLVKYIKPKPWRRATSVATANAVKNLMVGVTHGGTATNVAIPGIDVAAKTGTAQTSPGHCCTNWLVAFAPAQNPQVVVSVVVPYQPGLPPNPTGSAVAGPIAKAMLVTALEESGTLRGALATEEMKAVSTGYSAAMSQGDSGKESRVRIRLPVSQVATATQAAATARIKAYLPPIAVVRYHRSLRAER